ncbi:Hsp70 family protein [Nibrella saemangeumensis]|uniref:Hsp70 family protein n=1 Tax=Nibrella saemangeumensis TaxID=1084526 RepID=A0ABP8N8L1_9BACT
MATSSCGIDFGTSNSTLAVDQGGQIRLVPLEEEHLTIPSAIFFQQSNNQAFFGRSAVTHFVERQPGRFIRSLKRVLGTSLMKQGTQVNGTIMTFGTIITDFLKHLKRQAETLTGHPLEQVVMGRPVHFVDHNPKGDTEAQTELKQIALRSGFTNIEFQYEPIAAAFAHEVHISGEKLALVADLGGGTSDFSIIRLSKRYATKPDRSSDILASTGIRLGGNDLDKALSLAAIMPELGYHSTYGAKHLEVPLKPYQDLAEWSKVNFLYTPKLIMQCRQLLHEAHDKPRFSRLLRVLEQETGHLLLAAAEEAKIAFSDQAQYMTSLDFVEPDFCLPINRVLFEEVIAPEVDQIIDCARACMQAAGVGPGAIELVILTGGSTEVQAIQEAFRALLPQAILADQNKLSSVGLGLGYASRYTFGPGTD